MEKTTISIKKTNNPSILKFEANRFLTNHESFEFNNIDEAKASPLAQQLFYLPFIKKVYISGNFIALERFNIVEWEDVQVEVAQQIEHYLNEGHLVITTESPKKKTAITVYAEITPNPTVLKFVANKRLVDISHEFTSIDDAKNSPLATELFHLPFVKSVYIDENFVSITKYDVASWDDITMDLREFIRTYLENNKDVVLKEEAKIGAQIRGQQDQNSEVVYDDTSKEIIAILEEYVKPAVARDGGNIVFQSYDSKTKAVKVILQGACSGCPSSTYTLKNGIENILKEMLKEKVATVEAING